MTAKPRLLCGGIFVADTDVPPDHNGRQACRCGLLGTPGDAHHTAPPPVVDARGLAAGEREDG